MPTAEEWITAAADRLVRAGYDEIPGLSVNGHPVRGFGRADFKIRWMFTRLHTFVVLGHIRTATKDDMIRAKGTDQPSRSAPSTQCGSRHARPET